MKQFLLRRRAVLYLLLYLFIILYSITFPTTVAWFLFYAFTLLLVFSYASSSHTYVIRDVNWQHKKSNQIALTVALTSKWKLPFLLSSLKLTVSKDGVSRTLIQSALFSRQITVSFEPIELPRGFHDTFLLEIEGTSLFGIWTNRSVKTLPVDIAIYPNLLSLSSRAQLMKEIKPLLARSQQSSIHDFYVKEIRRFQNRDALSDIDWKTSMRRGQWMVKEYELEEEAPIDLYFYGQSTEEFEFLLSVAYSLHNELHSFIKGNLYLLGQYDTTTEIRQSQTAFLTIQPTSKNADLSQLFTESLVAGRKHIIIKGSHYSLPVRSQIDHSFLILDEHRLQTINDEVNANYDNEK